MPIPKVKPPPPPPRRAPPAVSLTQEVSSGTYTATHLQFQLSGVAIISQKLIQTKDAVSDIKMALATADDTIQRITSNPAILGPSPGESTRGGVDIQSLQFAASTRAKLAEQEAKQDAHYAALRESSSVGQEVRKAADDPSLRRYREDVECQLATSTFPGARFPRGSGAARPAMAPEEQQALVNPFTTVRRQSKSSALLAQAMPTSNVSSNSTNNSTSNLNTTVPYRPSHSTSNNVAAASAPPATHVHAPTNVVPSLYNTNGSASSNGANAAVPPSVVANGRYRPGGAVPTSSPPMSQPPPSQQPYGATPNAQPYYGGGGGGAYATTCGFPPTVTQASMAGAYGAGGGNAGYYGASPYPPQGTPQPVYGQYGQRPPMGNPQGTNRPTYTAL